MKMYALRHVATGEMMPEMLRRKGYSHWSPGVKNAPQLDNRLSTPRLVSSIKAARSARGQWVRGVATLAHLPPTMDEPYGEDYTTVTDVGRKTADLEVVEFDLVEVSP